MFDQATLAQLEAGYQAARPRQQAAEQVAKPKVSGIKRFAAGLLPTVGGALGMIGGSFVAPVAGTAAGGAAGSALGAALKQRLLGEKTNLGEIGKEAAFGAVPGVFKGAAAGVRAIKGAKAAKQATDAERAAQQIAEQQRIANAGRNVIGATVRGDANAVSQKAAEAQRFNSLAKQNIEKLGKDNATQGLPLANGGGTLVKPGPTPSFASEGIGLQPVPKVPTVPNRYATSSPTAKPTATDAYGVPLPEASGGSYSPSSTLLGKLSTNRTRAASGIKTDPGVGGIERADEAASTFQRLKITGTPEKQLRRVNEVMASHGKQVDDILAKNPIQLDGAAVKAQAAKAIEDPLKYAELDLSTPGAQKALNTHLDKFAQAKTAKDVNDYVKVVNKVAVKAKAKLDKGGTLTDKEAAALAAKRSGDEVLSQYPEIAPLKKDMATLFERNGDVTKQSEKTLGVPLLGIKSKGLAQVKSGVDSATGKVLNTADKVAGSAPAQATKKVGKSLFSQLATRAAVAPLTQDLTTQANSQSANSPSPSQNFLLDSANTPPYSSKSPPINMTGTNNIPSAMVHGDMSQSNNTNSSNASTTGMDYEQEARNALAAGDYKAYDAILGLWDRAEKKAAAGSKPLSAEASKVVSNAQVGIQALNDFNGLIGQQPSEFGRTNIPGVATLDRLSGGRASGALGTSGLNAARQQVIDVIARLRTGAAISKEEAARFETYVPQPGDPPGTRQQKSNYLMGQFQMVANRTGGAGTDLAGALGQH